VKVARSFPPRILPAAALIEADVDSFRPASLPSTAYTQMQTHTHTHTLQQLQQNIFAWQEGRRQQNRLPSSISGEEELLQQLQREAVMFHCIFPLAG